MYRNEIGSEFWDVPLSKSSSFSLTSSNKWFLSGRSALRAIIKVVKEQYNVRSIAIPAWCCESIIKPFLLEGIAVSFYPVYPDNVSLRQEIRTDCDAVLIMDFFGFVSEYECHNGIVIRDLTHSVFNNIHSDAQFSFGSLRKWCGFKTGGFASISTSEQYSQSDDYIQKRAYAMKLKKQYLESQIEEKTFLQIFAEAEEMLEDFDIYQGDIEEYSIVPHIDVETIIQRRRNNARILTEAFTDQCIFKEIHEKDCPLFVPILVENREYLQKYLADHGIFCPHHWPVSDAHEVDEQTKILYENELSLVCDQRYNDDDMYRIIQVLREAYVNVKGL